MALSDTQVNQIIVYVSFAILVGTAVFGTIIFFVRMKKRKVPEPLSTSSDDRSLQQSKNSSSSKKKSKVTQKKKYGTSDEIASEDSEASTESSSLLEHNDNLVQSHTGTMNKVLRSTFTSVLSEGLSIILHSSDSYMQVKMTLSGTELRWRSRKVMSTKSYKMNLKDIQFIEWGKQTNNFRREALNEVKDENCFSLVTVDTTFDFETSSKVERDALVQGFMLAIQDLREKGSV